MPLLLDTIAPKSYEAWPHRPQSAVFDARRCWVGRVPAEQLAFAGSDRLHLPAEAAAV